MSSYELNLSAVELETRTQSKHFRTYFLLDEKSENYQQLAAGDKKALSYLMQAALFIQRIHFQLDHPDNLPFLRFLNHEIKRGNIQAQKTKQLFLGQQGVNGFDNTSKPIYLAKGVERLAGKGFYPRDLTVKEFHRILIQMLEEEKISEVQQILSARTVVEREGSELRGVDYVERFSDTFRQVAACLIQAAGYSTNHEFNHFLRLQAKACLLPEPMFDAWADKQWAALQETPLEFTLVRENDSDEMTYTVFENARLKQLLQKHNIHPIAKDSLGARVGIINREGTAYLLKMKDVFPSLAGHMPYVEEYADVSLPAGGQSMVDVDLTALTGTCAEDRGGITIAENLPNDDKLSLKIGGGRRNVYHRQIRFASALEGEERKQFLNNVLIEEQHDLVSEEADFLFTVGHENAHSFGPRQAKNSLGKYATIIEEAKADTGALSVVDLLREQGIYTETEKKQVLVTTPVYWLEKSKPVFSDAHGVRAVMQLNYFIEAGAIEVLPTDQLQIHLDKMVPTAQEMLARVIRIQLDGDIQKAKQFVDEYFVWTPLMARLGRKLKQVRKILNGGIVMPMAEQKCHED